MKTLKITSNGRITIPSLLRKKYKLTLGRKLKIETTGMGILISPLPTTEDIKENVGILGIKGKSLLESLLEEKKIEREL